MRAYVCSPEPTSAGQLSGKSGKGLRMSLNCRDLSEASPVAWSQLSNYGTAFLKERLPSKGLVLSANFITTDIWLIQDPHAG